MPNLLRFYLTIRKPRNFLIILCSFIVTSLSMHYALGFDGDLGLTNLILSIEASTAGAVLMMVAEESAQRQKEASEAQAKTLQAVLEIAESHSRTLKGVLLIAEAQRDMLTDHASFLRALREGDERILKVLTERKTDDRL
jgi:hypothetical protein